jgi:hypothetical protein
MRNPILTWVTGKYTEYPIHDLINSLLTPLQRAKLPVGDVQSSFGERLKYGILPNKPFIFVSSNIKALLE